MIKRIAVAMLAAALSMTPLIVDAKGGGRSSGKSSSSHSSGKSTSSKSSSSHSSSKSSSSRSSTSHASPGTGAKSQSTQVKSYVKKDGTYVQSARRTTPDKNFNNNYSTKGNSNPYTGKQGSRVDPPKKH